MKSTLYKLPTGGTIMTYNGEAKYFPPLRPKLALDAKPAWLSLDEQVSLEAATGGEDDAALSKLIADAVCGALKAHRAAKDAAGKNTSQNRDALPDPKDPRRDFRSGDAVMDAIHDAVSREFSARTYDSALALDRRGPMVDRRALLGLDFDTDSNRSPGAHVDRADLLGLN